MPFLRNSSLVLSDGSLVLYVFRHTFSHFTGVLNVNYKIKKSLVCMCVMIYHTYVYFHSTAKQIFDYFAFAVVNMQTKISLINSDVYCTVCCMEEITETLMHNYYQIIPNAQKNALNHCSPHYKSFRFDQRQRICYTGKFCPFHLLPTLVFGRVYTR